MIKINSFRLQNTQAASRSKKKDTEKNFKDFDVALDAQNSTQSPSISSLSALAPLNELLQLQNVQNSHIGQVRSREQGQKILQELDKLRLHLLTGDLSVSEMRHLSEIVNQNLSPAQDPQLNSIIEEIEQRLAIEITKLEMSQT